MKCNVGKTEQLIRTVAGLAIIGVGVYFSSWWGAIGLILLASAALKWCPINQVLGLSTCKENEAHHAT